MLPFACEEELCKKDYNYKISSLPIGVRIPDLVLFHDDTDGWGQLLEGWQLSAMPALFTLFSVLCQGRWALASKNKYETEGRPYPFLHSLLLGNPLSVLKGMSPMVLCLTQPTP